jgi:hypothetical protein
LIIEIRSIDSVRGGRVKKSEKWEKLKFRKRRRKKHNTRSQRHKDTKRRSKKNSTQRREEAKTQREKIKGKKKGMSATCPYGFVS